MEKKSVHSVSENNHKTLYTIDDVRRMNAIMVRGCHISLSKDPNRTPSGKSYSVAAINSAWEKVSK